MYRQGDIATPQRIRQSLLATFDSCHLRARFALEDQRRTPGSMAARGTLFHRWAHQAMKIMRVNGERRFSVEQGMELLLATLAQIDVPSDEVVPITMNEMRWVRVLVTKWCESTVLDTRKVLSVEKRYDADLPLPNGRTVTITGAMDLVLVDPPEGVIVVDYKAGWKRPKKPRNEEKAAREGSGLTELGWVQNLVYSFLLFENFPSVNYTIFRERHVLWDEERYARTERWEHERVRDVLVAQVALLTRATEEGPGSEIWTPSAGPHCSLCSNPRACPILDDEQIDIETEMGRRRVAQEWHVAGEVRSRRRDILDGLVETYGPIEIPYAEGRRVVGWDVDPHGKRNFGIYEPKDIPLSPYDAVLAEAAREKGLLVE